MGQEGETADGQRHRQPEQAPGDDPRAPAQNTIDLEPGAHERDDHDELGQSLDDGQVILRVRRHAWQPRDGEQRRPDADADDGQGQRGFFEHHGQPRREQNQGAEAGENDDVRVHGWSTLDRCSGCVIGVEA
jgi:hypothetical protein